MTEAAPKAETKAKSGKGSLKARKTAARLLAVQAVYQALQNQVPPASLYEEYILYRKGMEIDGEQMVEADVQMFQNLMSGVTDRWGDIQQLIKPRTEKIGKVENLLASILICGAYEILAHTKIDTPIIINDYLNITVGFFDGNEPKLVNGILDALAKEVRQ
ncbi:MAG TPA: transcription antitermination factor NusB [Alphaproteobacteria bacterium]|nr:transcription antitermination protein NusB [Alphaproteobacteria bacterium]HOO49869.1 transcription antitermination factor NusB [Alphaproteobacteria bacterium]